LREPNNTFPGQVVMELAADALDLVDSQPAAHVAYRDLLLTPRSIC
jgi:hypothetical protein